ncbi:MAG: tetratricopeptide repeat protein [Bacteroidota bacterium]
MKYKHFLYLLIFLISPLLSFANKDLMADAQYAKGQYKEARVSYQALLNEGYQSAALYFNMGNACYKLDDIPSAILYYEKARHLSPADEDINFNIRFANQKTTDKIDEAPEFFLNKWWHGFILMFSLSTLSILSIVFIFLSSLVLIGYLFTRSVVLKKTSFYISIVLFAIGLVFIFMGNRQSAYFDSHKQAIVFTSTVTVKSSPASAAKTLFVIHEGTKVDVLETISNRIKIKLANGSEGWIGAGDVKEI